MREFKKGDRVKTNGSWLKKVGLVSDNRTGTVMYVSSWKSGTLMCEVLWDGEHDICLVSAVNLRRVK